MKELKLRKDQWHVKFYFWCRSVWDAFTDSWTPGQRSNLCMYLRAPLLMVVALGSHVALIYIAYYVFISYPVMHFGVWAMISFYSTLAFCAALVYAVRYGLDKLGDYRYQRAQIVASATPEVRNEASATADDEKGPGIIELIWLYLVAAKQKICPMIEFEQPTSKEVV